MLISKMGECDSMARSLSGTPSRSDGDELKKWERGTLQLSALATLTGCPQVGCSLLSAVTSLYAGMQIGHIKSAAGDPASMFTRRPATAGSIPTLPAEDRPAAGTSGSCSRPAHRGCSEVKDEQCKASGNGRIWDTWCASTATSASS